MPVTVVCPVCSATLPNVPDQLLGKAIKCTACRESVKVVPAAAADLPKAATLPPLPPPVAPPMPETKVARAIPTMVAPVPPPPAEWEVIDIDVIDDDEVIDVEVMVEEPPPPPATPKRVMTTKPAARRPADDEDDEPVPAPSPKAKKKPQWDDDADDRPAKARKQVTKSDDDDDRPAKIPVARKAVVAADDEEEPPRAKSRRRDDADDEYKPKKKSMVPMIALGFFISLVVIGGGGTAVYLLTKQPDTALATTTTPVWVPPPNATPTPTTTATPTEPTPPPSTPATRPAPTETRPTVPPATPATTPKPPATTPKPPDPPLVRDRISDEALAKLKRSTAYIEVDDGVGGGGTGSGWFGGEPGLIVTNAHVLGMLYPGAKEPAKVSVFTDSGVKGQQKLYEGQKVKVLAVDREMDLAVLQIVGEQDLPAPLATRPAAKLRELDKLVCLGFPGGRRLAERNRSSEPPTVTVTASAVSAFRNDDGGNLYSVQIQGGVVHGNSGGPVCDLDGNVVGVAVRVDHDHRGQMTNIASAVPVEYVGGLLAGRAAEGVIGQGYVKGDRVVYPVSVRCADALGRLKGVGVGVWIGEKGKPRPAGDTHAEAGGDVGYREIALTYDKAKKVATGEIDFPKDTDGRVYWAQAYYANALASKRYLAGNVLPAGDPPVEKVIADLTPKFAVDTEYKLTVSHATQVVERQERDKAETLARWSMTQTLKAKELVEKARAPTAHAQLDVVMDAADARVEKRVANEAAPLSQDFTDAKESVTKWYGLLSVGRDGRPAGATMPQLNTTPTTDGAKKRSATSLGQQWLATMGEALVKLPGKKVAAGDTWADSRPHHFKYREEQLLGGEQGWAVIGTVKEELTYTYLGRRDRGGRGEAVIKVDGVLRPVGADATTCGSVDGRLVVEEKTGVVLAADIKREFDLEAQAGPVAVRATGTEVVKVSREK